MLGEAFSRRAKHHDGIKELWETKWKFPVSLHHSQVVLLDSSVNQCSIGVYPFHDGKHEDFEPVFEYLIKVCVLNRDPAAQMKPLIPEEQNQRCVRR